MKRTNKIELTGKGRLYERVRVIALLVSAVGMMALGILEGSYQAADWYKAAYWALLACVILTLAVALGATAAKAKSVKESKEALRRKRK